MQVGTFFFPVLGLLSARLHFISPAFQLPTLFEVSFTSGSLTPIALLVVWI